jgi:hypothetical protein
MNLSRKGAAFVSNAPQLQIKNIPDDVSQGIVSNLMELHNLGKAQTDLEVADRVDAYFNLCATTSLKPSIESLALALSISRQTLYDWSKGRGCSPERAECIQNAKQIITAFVEQSMLSGKLNPVSAIFTLKNYSGWKNEGSFDERTDDNQTNAPLPISSLPKLGKTDTVIEVTPEQIRNA